VPIQESNRYINQPKHNINANPNDHYLANDQLGVGSD